MAMTLRSWSARSLRARLPKNDICDGFQKIVATLLVPQSLWHRSPAFPKRKLTLPLERTRRLVNFTLLVVVILSNEKYTVSTWGLDNLPSSLTCFLFFEAARAREFNVWSDHA